MDTTPKDVKITDLVEGLPRLRVFDEELKAYEENAKFSPSIPVVDRNTYLGIEVEVENVHKWNSVHSPYWTVTEDGSLRNHGHEFLSPPIRAWRVEHAFTRLLESVNSDVEFTERTSIHVHMNVRTLTLGQLEALVLTYMVFEKALFSFIGNNRYDNVFCVPLCETNMGIHLDGIFQQNHVNINWMKYTALNLLPIREKGTVEFRHLNGTKDVKRLMTWINLLLSLKKFALRNPPEYIWNRIETLNTTSEFRMLGEEVFGSLLHNIETSSFNKNIEDCVTYVKTKCIKNLFADEISTNITENSKLFPLTQIRSTLRYDEPWPAPIAPARTFRRAGELPTEHLQRIAREAQIPQVEDIVDESTEETSPEEHQNPIFDWMDEPNPTGTLSNSATAIRGGQLWDTPTLNQRVAAIEAENQRVDRILGRQANLVRQDLNENTLISTLVRLGRI